MNRRDVIAATAALAAAPLIAAPAERQFATHRFGVNYVPSRGWYYIWNDWNADTVARDFSAIAALGADHVRVMLVWPWFQPNPKFVSTAHLDRLDALMTLAAARGLDVLVTLYTGWLSGFAFRPPFLEKDPFYTAPEWRRAQDYFLVAVARRMIAHRNFLGFDIGNEINVAWSAPIAQGDAWMRDVLAQMHRVAPGRVHVNGVDHAPWFTEQTFSPAALCREQPIVTLHSWSFWTGAKDHGGTRDAPYVRLPAALTALARSYAGDPAKPIWLQEFGVCDVEMPATEVSQWMERAVANCVDQGVAWFTWWSSHDVDRALDFHPFEYDLGLLTVDNRPKPRAAAFKRLVERHRGRRVVLPKRPPPPPPTVRDHAATWRWLLDWMAANPVQI